MLEHFKPGNSKLLHGITDPFDRRGDRKQKRRIISRDELPSIRPIQSEFLVESQPQSSQVFDVNRSEAEHDNSLSSVSAITASETARYVWSFTAVANATITAEADDGIYPRIVINDTIGPAGSQTFAATFDAVVALPGCTGTLIAPDVVIAARHCGGGAGDQIRFGPNSGSPTFTATVQSVSFPAGSGSLLDGGDFSILFLTADVPENIAVPMRLTDATETFEGAEAAMIGYGWNGVGSTGHQGSSDGFRWGGTNIIDVYGTPAGASGQNIISTDFDDGSGAANTIAGSDPTPLEFEATTAPGDSGGPVLINVDNEWVIAGVLSGGTTPTSVYGDISWWTGVAPFRDEIEAAGGEFNDAVPTEDDHSDDLNSTATSIFFDSYPIARSEGYINTLGDRDVFSFELMNPARAIFDAVSIRNFDTYLRVYNANGDLIGENNDKPESISSQVRMELDAGQYFVSVGANNDGSIGQYRVAVRHNGPRDDHGQRFSNATPLTMNAQGNTVVTAAIDNGFDRDMFRFIADRSGELVLRTKALSGDLNTVLRVWDENRAFIGVNNNWNGQLDSRLSIDIIAGKNYYAHVDGLAGTQGDYRLFLIPQSGRGDRGRTQVDLTLPSQSNQVAAFGGPELRLDTQISVADNHLASTDLSRLDQYGPQPLNMIANGLG